VKRFALGSALSLRGRTFQGLSGFEGKPFHPPFTDVPVGAYVIAPVLDVVAFIGRDEGWGTDASTAARYTLLVGAAFSALTVLTGFSDWLRMHAGSEVRRITNSHALTMIVVSALVVTDLIVRWDSDRTSAGLMILGLVILGAVTLGSAIGGSLVFDKGYKVRARMKPPEPARSDERFDNPGSGETGS
jgi:uncharacterized membrane protein